MARVVVVQPLDVPSEPGVPSGTTTGPDTPTAPPWMCAAVGVAMLWTASEKHACAWPSRRRIVAVPVPTGSAGGDSVSPTIVMLNAVPPVFERSVLGQPPFGTGKMSAGCLRCFASNFVETESLTYGLVDDEVRWQIALLTATVFFAASVPARAVVSAIPASASTASSKPNRFMFLPPC